MKNKMTKLSTTLCIIHQPARTYRSPVGTGGHPQVLLGMKKRGFGKGRWNGFGGKMAVGETIEDAARRELREEAGITVKNFEKLGIIDFEFKDSG